MTIKIEKRENWWYLTLSEEGEAVKYDSLVGLAKALMQYARGEDL